MYKPAGGANAGILMATMEITGGEAATTRATGVAEGQPRILGCLATAHNAMVVALIEYMLRLAPDGMVLPPVHSRARCGTVATVV